jgi:hypothetical protein
MFSFEDGSEIEMVPNASEFLGSALTYGMTTVPWYTVSEEGRLLIDGFITESTNSFGYSLNVRSCRMFLISLSKLYFGQPSEGHMSKSGFHPVTVAERSKACTVFSRSEAGIVGSNSTHHMDVWYVYVFILCLCCPVFR